MQAGTAAIAAIKGYMREHIKLLEQTAKRFAEAQKHPAAKKRHGVPAHGRDGDWPAPLHDHALKHTAYVASAARRQAPVI